MPPKSKYDKNELRAVLALADGTILHGAGFGAPNKVSGEIVFNTGMVGYPESITDPSYYGQILTQTYPLIGNYGICPDFFESDRPKIWGYVVKELCREPSHWSSEKTLDSWLSENGVPGVELLDTRMLTKKLRTHGVMLGVLWVYPKNEEPDVGEIRKAAEHISDPNRIALAKTVSIKESVTHNPEGNPKVVLIDCGVKKSIVRSLITRGLSIVQMPIDTPADKILAENPSGVVLSNGPGDPKVLDYLVNTVKELAEAKIPIFGICLGCQIIALAMGGETYKLKYGHRGQNHPVMDLSNNKCYITSQNHGYAVDAKSLSDSELEVTFLNANDKTVEGVRHRRLPIFAVQFHPEANPGPEDTNFLFDLFTRRIKS